jgi:hypothetical protein
MAFQAKPDFPAMGLGFFFGGFATSPKMALVFADDDGLGRQRLNLDREIGAMV